jgi:hypothetical protein
MKLSLSLVLSVFVLACGPAPTAVQSLPVRASATDGALTVELLSSEPLHVGQNQVRYRVTHDGQLAPHALITQHPVMDMGSMKHACPLLNPDHAPSEDGLYPGLLVFTMATMDEAKWTLSLDVALEHDAAPVTVSLGEVVVADSALKQVVTRDGRRITLTMGFPEAPHVGTNELIITAHVAHDMMMMSFDPVTDLAFTVTPEMPSMGHGSAHNLAPTLSEDGLYRGVVNFSMPGDWVVHLGVAAGDATFGTFDFPFSL